MSTHIQRSALLPYPAQALYDLVNDVARYPEFLPWCGGVKVIERTDDTLVACLAMLAEQYRHLVANLLDTERAIRADSRASELGRRLQGFGMKISYLARSPKPVPR